MSVGSCRSPPTSQWLWSFADTSTSNSPESAISLSTRENTTGYSSIAQQSTGLPTCVKLGNSCLSRVWRSSGNGCSGIPAFSAISAKYSPSPPEFVIAPTRGPAGPRLRENTSRCSSQTAKSSQRIAL